MSNEEIESELSQLRAEVAALSEARRAQQKQQQKEAKDAKQKAAAADAASDAPGEEAGTGADFDIKGQVGELADLLETEMRESPLVTCLAVFAAGVLVGRILR